jgi:hypothetical protein
MHPIEMSEADQKHRADTLWKMLDAQCSQLKDSIASARTPFLLSLTWAFVWAWTIYVTNYGFISTFYIQRLNDSLSAGYSLIPKFTAVDHPRFKQFLFDCGRVSNGSLDEAAQQKALAQGELLPREHHSDCMKKLNARRKWAEETFLSSQSMSFPGGFSKLLESDLGVIGQAGLLLILAWHFYASRRENHAIIAFVDRDEESRRLGFFSPSFLLRPQRPFVSAEHLVYAYLSIAQRFMFIFSRYERPLLIFTIFLECVPALVASWEVYTDTRGIIQYDWPPKLMWRFVIEIVLLIFVWLLTWSVIKYVLDTSIILNGWYLASKKVWMGTWESKVDAKAPVVRVHPAMQSAEEVPQSTDGAVQAEGVPTEGVPSAPHGRRGAPSTTGKS